MKIAMIILAAGYSRRMGVLKPLLPVGGESALARTVGLGKTEKVHVISVVTGYRHEDVETELYREHSKNVRHIYNAGFDDGMFSSVQTGVHSLPHDVDGFLLLPVDHCAVKPETIDKVIATFLLSGGRAVVYPVTSGKRGHPPLIPRAFVEDIRNYTGDGGMQGYLSPYPFEEVDVEDAGIHLDMDTPDDYAALLRHLRLPVYPDTDTCQQLMTQYKMPDKIVRHVWLVEELAMRIADTLAEKGVTLNRGLLSAACLLHDIARAEPEHAAAGAKILLREGWPAAAALVAKHMELPDDYTPQPDEISLLYVSDKLTKKDTIMMLEDRLADFAERFAGDAEALNAARRRMARAQAILNMLRDRYGIQVADIVRDL